MAVVLGVMFGKTSFECSTSQAHHAAAHGLCDVLHVLFGAGSDLSQVQRAKKLVGAVTKLLDLGADPWLEDGEGRTAVDLAAASEKVKTAFSEYCDECVCVCVCVCVYIADDDILVSYVWHKYIL